VLHCDWRPYTHKLPTHPLHPVHANNTHSFRMTAAAGTKFAGVCTAHCQFLVCLYALQIVSYSSYHTRSMAGSSLRSLSKIPHCCLPSKFEPCLSFHVASHPLRLAKDHRLGTLLPYQQPNPIQASLLTTQSFIYRTYLDGNRLFGIWRNLRYPEWKGEFLYITHPYATCTHWYLFNLHVLGLLPAFIRSQDQTLPLIQPSYYVYSNESLNELPCN